MRAPADHELIAHVVATGDAAAFGELVRRHEPRVRGLLRRLSAGDVARADDLTQETFLLAFRHLARFRGESSLSTWLVRIAVRQHLGELRRRRPELAADVDRASTSDVHPAQRLALEDALARLRPEQRLVVVLSFAYGVSHTDIAAMTGWPLGTVKTHATRGRAALRELLADGGDDAP